MKKWKYYNRKGSIWARPYEKGEDLTGISVSDVDDPENDMGMVCVNPENQKDQWYVARAYFDKNYEKEASEITALM